MHAARTSFFAARVARVALVLLLVFVVAAPSRVADGGEAHTAHGCTLDTGIDYTGYVAWQHHWWPAFLGSFGAGRHTVAIRKQIIFPFSKPRCKL